MASIESGTSVRHDQILESLGEGGMGEVYRANDPRPRAARFVREARAVASLSYASILSIFDCGRR